jgi:tetratricopeptide (TPR) repeat protein/tRNA A-37 threonylcarbamoyl transferase component Bud32
MSPQPPRPETAAPPAPSEMTQALSADGTDDGESLRSVAPAGGPETFGPEAAPATPAQLDATLNEEPARPHGAAVDLPVGAAAVERTLDLGEEGRQAVERTIDLTQADSAPPTGRTVDLANAQWPEGDGTVALGSPPTGQARGSGTTEHTLGWQGTRAGQRDADRLQTEQDESGAAKAARLKVRRRGRPPLKAGDGTTVAGYELLSELGRGGMGVVYKARQKSLNRLVALKMLLHTGHARPEDMARFHVEAEAIAHLQHPNIVQVFEIGEHEGCPFFSLEFVEGQSLSAKIDSTPQPPAEAARLVQQVAEAMDVAHRRGIIHRDLKPANILLTTEGQPKVTDFGLAKRFEDAGDGPTREGAIMGTPSYMAPEQAAGKTREVGPAGDIYSLGAILYDMLTGRPPFRGTTLLDTLQQVQRVEPVPPVRLQDRVPRDLDTICLKCLEKDPKKRYTSAGALAEDLRRFLAGEPILARPTPTWERAWKWARRRPALAALTAVSVLAVVGVLSLAFLWLDSSRRAAEGIAEQQKKLADYQTQEARKEHELWQQAERQRLRAEARFRDAREAVDVMLTEVGGIKLAHEPHMEKIRRELLEKAVAYYGRFLKDKGDDASLRWEAGLARLRLGEIRRMLGEPGRAEAEYRKGLAQIEDLERTSSGQLKYRRELAIGYNNLANLLREVGKLPEAEKLNGQALTLRRELPSDAANLKDLAAVCNNRGIILQKLARPRDAEQSFQEGEKILARLADGSPRELSYRQELARCLDNLGTLQAAMEKPAKAAATLGRARDLLEKLVKQKADVPEYREDLAYCCQHLGDVWRDTQPAKAEEVYKQSRRLCTDLVHDFPTVPAYRQALAAAWNSLAVLLQAAGRQPEADKAFAEALDIRAKIAADFPRMPDFRRSLASAYNNRGILLHTHNRLKEAEEAYDHARTFFADLTKTYPDVPDYQQELAGTYLNLSTLRASTGLTREAEKDCREAAAIQKKLAATHPQASYRQELARIELNLGTLLRLNGDLTGSEKAFHAAVDGFTRLHAELPNVPDYPHQLAVAWKELANTLRALKRGSDAEDAWKQSLDLLGKLTKRLPRTPIYRQDLGRTWNDLAVFQAAAGRLGDAGKSLDEAAAAQEKLVAYWPDRPDYRQELSRTRVNLGILNAQGNHLDEATTAFRKATAVLEELEPKLAFSPSYVRDLITAHSNLAALAQVVNRSREADKSDQRVLALQERLVKELPNVPAFHLELGRNLHAHAQRYRKQGKFAPGKEQAAAAVTQLEAALKLARDDWRLRQELYDARLTLTEALARLGDYAAAAEAVDAADKVFGKIRPAGGPVPRRAGQRVAAVLGRCAALVRDDAKKPEAARKELAQAYADQAMVWLRQAVKDGFRDAAHLRRNEDFQSLRGRPDFQELLADMERRAAR